ncbi:MAG TPA: flagellar motor switch protein FliG, partial [Pararhizobium sp.]|nr:flagellar motor switch protein FliG [Pararhizobium sp.]
MQYTDYGTIPTKPLSRPEKAAAILLAMGKPVAGKLLKFFEQAELQKIIAHAQVLRSVPPDELEKLVAEFEELFTEGAGLMDNARVMEGILEEGLTPDEVDGLLGRRVSYLSDEVSIWERVEKAGPEIVSAFLANESPQTTAYIVSMLPSAAAGKLVMALPTESRADIVHRA